MSCRWTSDLKVLSSSTAHNVIQNAIVLLTCNSNHRQSDKSNVMWLPLLPLPESCDVISTQFSCFSSVFKQCCSVVPAAYFSWSPANLNSSNITPCDGGHQITFPNYAVHNSRKLNIRGPCLKYFTILSVFTYVSSLSVAQGGEAWDPRNFLTKLCVFPIPSPLITEITFLSVHTWISMSSYPCFSCSGWLCLTVRYKMGQIQPRVTRTIIRASGTVLNLLERNAMWILS